MGGGSYIPTKSEEDGPLDIDYFTFSSLFHPVLQAVSDQLLLKLIGHAGSSSNSIFETLQLGKPLLMVVNEDLMNNYQSKLAEELADRKRLYCVHPQTLDQTVAEMDLNSLLLYSPGDANQWPST